jgi:hypothetical protein
MAHSNTYYTLIGSLPTLPRRFDQADRVPISRLKLRERLKMLDPQDATVVSELSEFLVWERQSLERTDEEFHHQYAHFEKTLQNSIALAMIRQIVSVGSIIAGLRRRRLQRDAPAGQTPIHKQMARHWEHPDFRLGVQFPWISEMDEILNSEQPFDVEHKKFDINWGYAKRLSDQYFFSFESVLLYLFRWEMVDRWTRRDAKIGQIAFEKLVSDAMGPYTNLFAEESAGTAENK